MKIFKFVDKAGNPIPIRISTKNIYHDTGQSIDDIFNSIERSMFTNQSELIDKDTIIEKVSGATVITETTDTKVVKNTIMKEDGKTVITTEITIKATNQRYKKITEISKENGNTKIKERVSEV